MKPICFLLIFSWVVLVSLGFCAQQTSDQIKFKWSPDGSKYACIESIGDVLRLVAYDKTTNKVLKEIVHDKVASKQIVDLYNYRLSFEFDWAHDSNHFV